MIKRDRVIEGLCGLVILRREVSQVRGIYFVVDFFSLHFLNEKTVCRILTPRKRLASRASPSLQFFRV